MVWEPQVTSSIACGQQDEQRGPTHCHYLSPRQLALSAMPTFCIGYASDLVWCCTDHTRVRLAQCGRGSIKRAKRHGTCCAYVV